MRLIKNNISRATLERIPSYLAYLKEQKENGCITVSATSIAKGLGLGEVQVRKDLSSASNGGRPKIGYITEELVRDLEKFLGTEERSEAIVVGSGKLGLALLDYHGFEEFGIRISAGFDKLNVQRSATQKPIYHISELGSYCSQNDVKVGIITTPSDAAQDVCDAMVACGITAIWNFAPIELTFPENVTVYNEKLVLSLCMLCKQTKHTI